MPTFIIEIHPKKASFDPLARSVQSELIEASGMNEKTKVVTQRLYKISGEFTDDQIHKIAETLLVDPVVETAHVETKAKTTPSKKPAAKKKVKEGWVLDVWPKPGVTDPVGETVAKGVRDLGFQGPAQTSSAQRYIFPEFKDSNLLKNFAKKNLANELVHDIHLRKLN